MSWENHLLIFLAKNVFTTFCSCYHSTGQNKILADENGILASYTETVSQAQIFVLHLLENILEI